RIRLTAYDYLNSAAVFVHKIQAGGYVKRRDFLKSGLAGLGTLAGSQLFAASLLGQSNQDDEARLQLEGAILDVHDPVIIKQDDSYYLFSTGVGIPVRRSTDLETWRVARGGTVFHQM